MQLPEQIDFNLIADDYANSAVIARESAMILVERLLCWKQMPEVVLDLGAGTGFVTEFCLELSDCMQIHALDKAEAMLAQVPNSARVTKIVGQAHSMPCRDQTYDAVLANMLLPWCSHWPALFAEIKRVLKPGGMLLFSTLAPDGKRLPSSWHPHACWRDLPEMKQLGDILAHQSYRDVVMDQMPLVFAFDDFEHMKTTLQQSGILTGRPVGVEESNDEPLLNLELIFGHALLGQPQGEFAVSVSAITRR